jgi:lysine 6-dehydrogenase
MKILVLGCGLMGRAIALDLLESKDVDAVTVTDVSKQNLEALENEVQSEKLTTRRIDATNRSQVVSLLKGFDVATNALPHSVAVSVVRASIEAKVPMVDLTYEDEHMKLDADAKHAGVIVVPGCGVAPGLSNILTGYASDQLDKTESAEILCGGLTPKISSPLRWRFVFTLEGAWGLYLTSPRIVKDGKIVRVEPRSGLERVSFPDPFGNVEAFYTDGLASLLYTMKDKIPNMVEKTVRWQGNVERVGMLADCGLLSDNPIDVNGTKVTPRHFSSMVMSPILELGDERDVTLFRVDASGEKDGARVLLRIDMVDHYDEKRKVSSMGRTTGYPCSVAAMMIGRGEITGKGVVPPEVAIRGKQFDEFEKEMNKRDIVFKKKLTKI